jgi:hypothetical protein
MPGETGRPLPPRSCVATSVRGGAILSHRVLGDNLDALGDERREALGLGFGEVKAAHLLPLLWTENLDAAVGAQDGGQQ